MRPNSILGNLALAALVLAACPPAARAESLTRSSCWTSTLDTGATRTMCLAGSGRVKMNNRNRTSDNKGWSTCEWSGQYLQTDAKVIVAALGKAIEENVMLALLVSPLACATAQGRLPLVKGLVLVLVTNQPVGTTRSSSVSIWSW